VIRRLIEIVLDPDAAKKLEKDIKRTLDSGSKEGADKAEKNLALVERAMARLKLAALKIGGALAAAFGVHQIVRFGRASVEAAMEATAVWQRLAGQLASTGTAFRDVEAEIRAAARALQDTTTIGDEEFAAVLTDLVGITGDYGASLAEVRTVADLAVAKQMDLSAAAKLVGKAMVGETAELKRYGIIVEEGADAMDALRGRFAGMAENEAASLQGRVTQLKNEFGDLKEAIGDVMIEAGGGTSALDSLIGGVKGLTSWIEENRSAIANWGRLIIATFRAVFETGRTIARGVVNAFDILASGIALRMLDVQQGVAKAVNFMIEGINRLPGVDIDFRMNEMTPQQFAEAQGQLLDDIENDTTDLADAVWDLGQAYRDVGTAAAEAAAGQSRTVGRPPSPNVSAPSGSGGEPRKQGRTLQEIIWDDEAKAREETLREQERLEEEAGQRHIRRLETIAAAEQAAREFREREMEKVRDAATQAGGEIASAFETAFAGMAQGFQAQEGVFATAVQAAREAGAGIVGALVHGRAEEQMAAGTAALASGTWPPNPAAIAAAFKHFAAAALYRAIPGVIRGGLGGRGSGGGVGSIPRGGIGTSVPATQQVAPPEVHIYMDPLSPSNAKAQAFVAGAMQNAQERYGPNVKLHVHPGVA
jgi:hypothetical protein